MVMHQVMLSIADVTKTNKNHNVLQMSLLRCVLESKIKKYLRLDMPGLFIQDQDHFKP